MQKQKQSNGTKKPTLTEAEKVVNKANQQENPFEPFHAFKTFDRNGIKLYFQCFQVKNMDKELIDWAFNLLQRNMKEMYEQSSWGWNKRKKLQEMKEKNARYLVGFQESGEPVAFSHFRFDMDFDHAVLYCYEIQIDETCRRKGVGRFMLQILELMAFKAELEKVILTVFLHNVAARECFKKLGYAVDETSPETSQEDICGYQILSKPNKRVAKNIT